MNGQKIRVLELAGRPYDMGFEHGERFADAIRHLTAERVALSGGLDWSGRAMVRPEVLALADACLEEHRRYAPELVEELQGMADATDLSLAELIVVNGFTDFVDTVYNAGREKPRFAAPAGADNCTAFIVPDGKAEGGQGFYGQTWDLHDSSMPHVILLRGAPEGKPGFLSFTTVGCVGMIGMNEEGIAVGINNLVGADGQIGVTWPFVIRKILEQTDLEAALSCITEAKLAGAHNYLLFDKEGRGYNVEAMSTALYVTELGDEAVVHTNHCLAQPTLEVEREREAASQANSEARLEKAQKLLAKSGVTPEDLQELTRDQEAICRYPNAPGEVATCGAALMRPKTLDFWAVWGLPSENAYERFTV